MIDKIIAMTTTNQETTEENLQKNAQRTNWGHICVKASKWN